MDQVASKGAAEALRCLYSGPGRLRIKTDIVEAHRLVMHDISLINDDLFQRLYNSGRPKMDAFTASGTSSSSQNSVCDITGTLG